MKHTRFLLAFAALLLSASTLWACDFYVVNNGVYIYYNITSNTAPYTVEVTNYCGYGNYSGSVVIPSSVTYQGITYSVTSIGNSAFLTCTGLTSVTIPNTVTSIGYGAFMNCSGLTTVTIPNTVTSIGDYAFSYCTGLTFVTIPNSVTSIGDYAFSSCSGLTSVTIPNSITRISYGAFGGCSGLTSVTIPNTVTSIGNYAFSHCSGLTSVTIPNTVTSIGDYAFAGCLGLTSVTIPNSVTSIGGNAFQYLPNLNYSGNATGRPWGALCVNGFYADSLYFTDSTKNTLCSAHKQIHLTVIPNSVTSIGNQAFYFCNRLASVTIPNTVTSIGDYAFSYCTGLTSVTIPNSVTSIGDYAFSSCSGLTSVTIPNSITRISYGAFGGCSGLTSVTIPNTVTSIGNYAFSHCSGLTSLTIPNSVTSIGDYAFADCSGLTSVTIPNSVDTIMYWAFIRDSALTSITFRKQNTKIGAGAFSGIASSTPVYVPCGASAWYTAKLSNFSNISEVIPYAYSMVSQDTTMGTVVTITTPNCYNGSIWAIRATADSGYVFSHWSDGDTNAQRTLTVIRDTALTAYFTSSSQQWYNFVVMSEDTNKGTVQIITQPSQASPQATIIALPNTGYTFARWSDGNTQNPRSLTVTQDTTLVAYFTSSSPQWYNFVVISEDTNKGRVQIVTQPTQASPQATIIALPNTGYTFARWSDGNTQNPRSLTVTQDTVLVACFTQSGNHWFNFTVVSEDPAKGTVQVVTQPTQENPQAIIVALPNTGYTFARWSDGNTQNPRTLTVTQDTVLIAYFTSNQGIAEAENDNISIRTANGHILLEGINGEHAYVTDVLGRVIYNATVNERTEIAVRNRGVYFVKIGSRPAKKVVVAR